MTSIIETSGGEWPVPYGNAYVGSVYINGVNRYFFRNLKVVKKLNQMSYFELELYDVTYTDANVALGNQIMIFLGNTLYLKGRLDRPKFVTQRFCTVKGYGMEVKLKDKEVNALTSATSYGTNRFQYTNVASSTIVNEICSTNGTGLTPWDLTPGTNDNYGAMSVRFENSNKLKALGAVAGACTNTSGINYDWWVSQSGLGDNYATDYFNISARKGSSSSVFTFEMDGVNQNAVMSDHEEDYDNTANFVNVVGYGDGVNQLRTSCFNNTGDGSNPRYTITTQALTATYTGTVTVADTSKLTAGTAIIGEERVTFSIINATTINISARGLGGITTRTTHPKGIYIANYISPAETNSANWQAGSSMDTYGRKEITIEDKSIIDLDTLQTCASRTLLDRMSLVRRITVVPQNLYETITAVSLGDNVTINDSNTGLSGAYRIVGEELNVTEEGDQSIVYEISNRRLYLLESIDSVKETTEKQSIASQGATNCWQLPIYENCDSTHPLNIRFFMPTEAVAVNKLALSYKVKNFRAYETANANTPNYSDQRLATSASCVAASTEYIDLAQCPKVTGGTWEHTNFATVYFNQSGNAYDDVDWILQYYSPSWSSWRTLHDHYGESMGTATNPPAGIFIAHIETGESEVQDSECQTRVKWVFNDPTTSSTKDKKGLWVTSESYHSHAITFGIYENSGSPDYFSPSLGQVTVKIGTDGGTMYTVGSYTGDQNGLDVNATLVANNVIPTGGTWYNIEVTPKTTSCPGGRMRIEANLYLQIFLQSRVKP